jgi:hypothetical protein
LIIVFGTLVLPAKILPIPVPARITEPPKSAP